MDVSEPQQPKEVKSEISWNDVKVKLEKFHNIEFNENWAIDVDFGYWLVNQFKQPAISENEIPDEVLREGLKYSKTDLDDAYLKGFNDCNKSF